MRRFFVAAVMSLHSMVTLAQAAVPAIANAKFADPAAAHAAPVSPVASMGQVTLALLAVLAVMFAVVWAMRQFKRFNRATAGVLEVVQGISVGPKERAVLIRVHGQQLLVGVAPGCVNLLLHLPLEAGAPAEAPLPIDAATINTPSFKALLKRSMGLS